MELDGEQQALVAELHEAHAEIMQGGNTALILTKLDELLQRAEKAESRLDVLEANGFIVALKWIWEKLCELGNKMQKAMIDIGENFPGFGGKAKRAAEFQDLDKLYEKELSRIDKLAGKNELGGEVNEKEYNALKANIKLDYEARQGDLHKKHEQQVDAKYGQGMYQAQQQAKAEGREVTPQQKEAIWKADSNCRYNQIDVKQQEHAQREKHGKLLVKKYPNIHKVGQAVGEKASAAGQAVSNKFRAMVAKKKTKDLNNKVEVNNC